LARSPDALNHLIAAKAEGPLSAEEQRAAVERVLGAALTHALAAQGWQISALPGADVELAHEGHTVLPFKEVHDWGETEAAAEAWTSRCQDLKLAGVPVLSPT